MARSVRGERRELAARLRTDGRTWREVADSFRQRWPELTPRAAMRLAHGWTQRQVVDAWSNRWPDQRAPESKEISRWEIWPSPSGARPSLDTLDRLAALYQCSVSDLLADFGDYRHLDDQSRPLRLPAVARQRSGPSPEEDDDLDRRRMVKLLGGAAAAFAVEPHGLLREFGGDPLERFEARRRALIDSDNLLGPRHVMPAARHQFAALQAIRDRALGDRRLQLLGLHVEYADFLGWLHQDAGEHREAQFWLDRAFEWSLIANDSEATAFILARKSQLAADMGHAGEAVDAGETAMRLAPPESRLKAVAAIHAGYGHALHGNGSSCERRYEIAYQIEEGCQDPDPSYGLFLDRAYIAAYHAHSAAVLGDYPRSLDLFDDNLPRVPDSYYRDNGVYLARCARAQAGAGDIDRASANGLHALTIGTETGSARIMTELHRLNQTLRLAGTTEFSDAMDKLEKETT